MCKWSVGSWSLKRTTVVVMRMDLSTTHCWTLGSFRVFAPKPCFPRAALAYECCGRDTKQTSSWEKMGLPCQVDLAQRLSWPCRIPLPLLSKMSAPTFLPFLSPLLTVRPAVWSSGSPSTAAFSLAGTSSNKLLTSLILTWNLPFEPSGLTDRSMPFQVAAFQISTTT